MTHAGHRAYKKVDQKNRPCDLSEKLKALQGLFPEKSYTFISQVVRSMKLKQSQYTAETIDYLTRYSNNMISLSPLQSIDVIPSEQNKGKLYRNYVYAGA